jgi:signal transduction histidine kinase
MENKNIKNYYALDVTAIAIAFIAILCSTIKSVNNIYLIIGISGLLFLSRYIFVIYNEDIRIKQGLLVALILMYTLLTLIDKNNFMFFTIYFIASALTSEGAYGKVKKTLLLILPEILLIIKVNIFRQKYEILEILIFEAVLLFFGLIVIIIDKLSIEYLNTNSKMNNALVRAAINELEGKRMNKELAMKNVLADRNARLEEREKISMDIHNSVGHTITAAIMALDAAEVIYDSEKMKAKDKLLVANSRMHESLNSIRKAVRVLNNKDIMISIEELLVSLSDCMKQFELDTDVRIRHNFDGTYQKENNSYIDAEHGNFVYGALKECLSNGVRHGAATAFIVMFEIDDRHVKFVIQDNGKGLGILSENEKNKLFKNGFGLRKIKDYVDNIGGDFQYNGEEGFVVSITLPLMEGKQNAK